MYKKLRLFLLVFIIYNCNFQNYQSKIKKKKHIYKKLKSYQYIKPLIYKASDNIYNKHDSLHKQKKKKFTYRIKPYQLFLFVLFNLIPNVAAKNDTCSDDTELIAFFRNCCPDGWEKYQRPKDCLGFGPSLDCELILCERTKNPVDEIKNHIEDLRDWVLGLFIALIVVTIVSFFCYLGLWAK